MSEPLVLTALENVQPLNIATSSSYFVVRSSLFSVFPEDSSQATLIEYFQPTGFLDLQWPGSASISEHGGNCSAKDEKLVWRLISLCSHNTRRICRNALRAISTFVVTSAFACQLGRRTDPRFLNDDTLSIRSPLMEGWWPPRIRGVEEAFVFSCWFRNLLLQDRKWFGWLKNQREQWRRPQTSDLWCRLMGWVGCLRSPSLLFIAKSVAQLNKTRKSYRWRSI